MTDNALFEGISGELRSALVSGYGALLEGLGDARIASFLYRRILPGIFRSIFNPDMLARIHAMVNSPETYGVTVYSAGETAAGAPLTVKFTRSSGKPAFIREYNVIEIPVLRELEHSIYRVERSKVRGEPYVMAGRMPYPLFVRQLRKAWDETPGYSYDVASIKETLLRELYKWFAENRSPETIRNPGAGGPGDPADAELGSEYRTDRMSRGDAMILRDARGWATPDVMRRHKAVADRKRANILMGRPEYAGIPVEDREFLERFQELAHKYNEASSHATNRELQARITALIPWLIRLQAEKGELPLQPTLDDMLDKVFDLPKDGPGIVRAEREAAKACILPGAFRSAARRCAGLVDAANRMMYSYDMSTAERIECLAQYMERNASDGQVSREL